MLSAGFYRIQKFLVDLQIGLVKVWVHHVLFMRGVFLLNAYNSTIFSLYSSYDIKASDLKVYQQVEIDTKHLFVFQNFKLVKITSSSGKNVNFCTFLPLEGAISQSHRRSRIIQTNTITFYLPVVLNPFQKSFQVWLQVECRVWL